MISSGLCFLLGIQCPFHGPDYHSLWATQRGADQPLGLPERILVPLVRHVTDLRNICAHHGRLWNRGFLIPPRLAQKPVDLRATLDQTATQAPAKLYNAACLIAHVIRTVAPASSWRVDFTAHIDTHPEGGVAAMGFPADWKQRPLWQ
ncbi:Abi family protein [Sphingomonas flavalba]|uniref:Abi family protein n=1 Tax=Sphingomonas flavalba TaxID=2559804 RepID=UPI0039DF58DC